MSALSRPALYVKVSRSVGVQGVGLFYTTAGELGAVWDKEPHPLPSEAKRLASRPPEARSLRILKGAALEPSETYLYGLSDVGTWSDRTESWHPAEEHVRRPPRSLRSGK